MMRRKLASTTARNVSALARPVLVLLLLSSALTARPAAAAPRSPAKPAAPSGPLTLVPESALGALLLDGPDGEAGLRALLAAAAPLAPSLQPSLAGQDLRRSVGVDLLSPAAQAEAGLAPKGPRALVLGTHAVGLSAPVADAAAAKRALDAWLAQLGPARATRQSPLPGPLASGGGGQERAGWIVPATGGQRLVTASGRGAVTLAIQLAHVGRKNEPPLAAEAQLSAAALQLEGPALLWVSGAPPVRGALLRLELSAQGAIARGLLLPLAPPAAIGTIGQTGQTSATAAGGALPLTALLAGSSPPVESCGPALLCVRAAPGPLLRLLFAQAARAGVGRLIGAAQRDAFDTALQALATAATGGALLRVDGLDARSLGGSPAQGLAALDLLAASGAAAPPVFSPAADAGPAAPAPAAALALAASSNAPGGNTVALAGPPPACAGADAGLEWFAAPCRRPGPEFSPAGGPTELSARLDAAAFARALAPLNPLDALAGPTAGTLLAVKLLWGGLLAGSGPVTAVVRPPVAPAPSGSLSLELRWPLSGKTAPQ